MLFHFWYFPFFYFLTVSFRSCTLVSISWLITAHLSTLPKMQNPKQTVCWCIKTFFFNSGCVSPFLGSSSLHYWILISVGWFWHLCIGTAWPRVFACDHSSHGSIWWCCFRLGSLWLALIDAEWLQIWNCLIFSSDLLGKAFADCCCLLCESALDAGRQRNLRVRRQTAQFKS